MDRNHRLRLVIGLAVSLGINGIFALVFILGRSPPPAIGQTADGSQEFVLGTEKLGESPVCFILRKREPHLLVYKVDPTGRLFLLDSRDIQFDLMVVDGFFGAQIGTTMPSVAQVKKAVEKGMKDRLVPGQPGTKDSESTEEK